MEILNIKDELIFHKIRLENLDKELKKEFDKFFQIFLKEVRHYETRFGEYKHPIPTYPMLDKTYRGKHWWEYTDVPKELIDYRISLVNHIECIENLMTDDVQFSLEVLLSQAQAKEYFDQLKKRYDNSYSFKFKMDDIPLDDVLKK